MQFEERLRNILLSARLGPLAEWHGSVRELSENGIIEAVCSCGKPRGIFPKLDKDGNEQFNEAGTLITYLHIPAKHPVADHWQDSATQDHAIISETLREWPEIGFAVVTGVKTVVLDLDIRPSEKDGVAAFKKLCAEAGQEFPRTVTVLSGSGKGAMHLYFNIPESLDDLSSKKEDGIDFLRNRSAAIAPGSTHESGDYYKFAPGLSPDEVQILNVPDWLLQILRSKQVKSTGQRVATGTSSNDPYTGPDNIHLMWDFMLAEGPPDGAMAPGRLREDSAVLWKMKNVSMRQFPADRSYSDARWAWTLVRYCCHHWAQFIRLWRNSAIRTLPDTRCGDPAYEYGIMRRAFRSQDQQWKNLTKRPVVMTGNPELVQHIRHKEDTVREVPRSEATMAVLALNASQPHLRDREIADILNIEGRISLTMTRNNVKKIRQSYAHMWRSVEK